MIPNLLQSCYIDFSFKRTKINVFTPHEQMSILFIYLFMFNREIQSSFRDYYCQISYLNIVLMFAPISRYRNPVSTILKLNFSQIQTLVNSNFQQKFQYSWLLFNVICSYHTQYIYIYIYFNYSFFLMLNMARFKRIYFQDCQILYSK